jgi:hypothetical protein
MPAGQEAWVVEAGLPEGDAALVGQGVGGRERLEAAVGIEPGAVGDGVARLANDIVALEKAPIAY